MVNLTKLLHARCTVRVIAAAFCAAGACCHAQSSAPANELKLSVAVSPALPLGAAAKAWAEAMAAATPGRIEAKIHPGAALAQRDPGRELFALRDGEADLAVGSALAWSQQLPALALFALPWIAPEPEDLAALVASEDVAGELTRRMDAAGVILLAMAPLGHRSLATIERPVRAPADLAGMRIRVTGGRPVIEVLAALGALPEAMSFAQAQQALAERKLDGQDGMATSFAAARLPATGYRQLLRWGASGDAMLFAARRPVWDGWTDAERRTALATARSLARDATAMASEHAAEASLVAQGMGDTRLTRAGHAAFAAAAASARFLREQSIGAELVAAARQAVALAREVRDAPAAKAPAADPAKARAN